MRRTNGRMKVVNVRTRRMGQSTMNVMEEWESKWMWEDNGEKEERE